MAKKNIDMTSGPIFSKMLIFVIPLLLTNLLQQLYNMADMLVAGRFAGELALAAVGATQSLTNMITNILVGISIGVSTVIAQALGAKDKECADRVVHTSMSISVFGSVLLAIIGIIICKPILILMNTPANILDKSVNYMRIIFAGYPISSLYNFGSAILRAKGDTKRPLIFLAISGAVNVVLNCVFVIVFHWGVEGVAFSTVISQLLSAIMVLIWLFSEEYPFKVEIKKIKIHGAEFKRVLGCGIPIAAQSAMFSFANLTIQSSVNSFGELAVAGAGAASNINNILYVILNAPSHASTIFTGQNFGAKKFERIPKIMYMSTLVVMLMWLVSGTLIVAFAKQLIGFFADDEMVINYGSQVVKVLCGTYFLCGIMEAISGSLKGINKSMISMINSLVSLFGIRIVWVFTYFASHRSLPVLYVGYPLSWIFAIVAHSLFFIYYFKKIKKENTLI